MAGLPGLYLLPVLLLAACASKPPAKNYSLDGEIHFLAPAAHTALILHHAIPGWKDADTTEFTVKPESDFARLRVADHIQATVVVRGESYWLTGVKVLTLKFEPPRYRIEY